MENLQVPPVDGGSNPTPSLQIREISKAEAKPFIERWHYSGNTPTGKNVFFGCFLDGQLYAVANYGVGVNQVQEKFLNALLFGEEKILIKARPGIATNLYELKRLCRLDPQNEKMPLTKFLSVCHKILKKNHGIRAIISFSDPMHNRLLFKRQNAYDSGGLYKAANFTHIGKTNEEVHVVDKSGKMFHRRVAYKYKERVNKARAAALGILVTELKGHAESQKASKKGDPIKISKENEAMSMAEARDKLGLKMVKTLRKDRWFLDLGEPNGTAVHRKSQAPSVK